MIAALAAMSVRGLALHLLRKPASLARAAPLNFRLSLGLCVASAVRALAPQDLTEMSLEDLMNVKVTPVSRKEQNSSAAGAAVFVLKPLVFPPHAGFRARAEKSGRRSLRRLQITGPWRFRSDARAFVWMCRKIPNPGRQFELRSMWDVTRKL